ncbi:MAG: PIG-L family deacetylase [Gemmatimonadota bacterium]|nr:PIG-L family deacetylase [Gemmatimonadota bacterium]
MKALEAEDRQTLLVVLAHPDDEVGAVAAMLAQRARGDRVVLCWLTRGEMTEAFGPISPDEVIARRTETGRNAGRILGIETRFLDFPDTAVESGPAAARRVAKLIAEVQPTGVLTFGDAWRRGLRHPDHQATGRIVRDAITLARIQKVVAPARSHRREVPVFTYRGLHSALPSVAIDAEPYLDKVFELGRLYFEALEFPHPGWLEERLRIVGRRWGLAYAEEFDAWETNPGLVSALLPGDLDALSPHPERRAESSIRLMDDS